MDYDKNQIFYRKAGKPRALDYLRDIYKHNEGIKQGRENQGKQNIQALAKAHWPKFVDRKYFT